MYSHLIMNVFRISILFIFAVSLFISCHSKNETVSLPDPMQGKIHVSDIPQISDINQGVDESITDNIFLLTD